LALFLAALIASFSVLTVHSNSGSIRFGVAFTETHSISRGHVAHSASYLFGFVGGIVLIVRIWRRREKGIPKRQRSLLCPSIMRKPFKPLLRCRSTA